MFGSAFYIFLQRQFFIGIPRDYFEAARMDGDGYFSMFRRIALPLAKPALIVTFIFEIQAKWFDLITPLIYLRDQALFTAPLGMKILLDRYNAGGGGEGDYQVIMAGTLLLDPADDHPVRRVPEVLHPRHRGPGQKGIAAPRRVLPSAVAGTATERRRALLVLGLDIGGTKLAAGVVDATAASRVRRRADGGCARARRRARAAVRARAAGGRGRRRRGTRSRPSGSAAAARSIRAAAS